MKLFVDDHLKSIVNFQLDENNQIARIFIVVNPDKLLKSRQHTSAGAIES